MSGHRRLALRLALRDVRQYRGRAALIAVMVALPVAAGTFVLTTLESNKPYGPEQVQTELGPGLQAKIEGIGGPIDQYEQRDIGFWFWNPVGWNPYYEGELDAVPYPSLEQDLEGILPAGDELVRALNDEVRLSAGTDAAMSVALQTDFTDADVAARFTVLEGRLPRDGEVAVTEEHRDLGFDLGDTVEVTTSDGSTVTATISGVTSRYVDMISPVLLPSSGPLDPPDEVVAANFDYPLWYVTGDAPVTWSDVQKMNSAGAFVTSRDVLLDPPPQPTVQPWYRYFSWESVSVIAALVVVGLLEAIWLIGPAFAVGARRDTRSLALLAVNGAPASALRDVLLARGLLTGAVGSVVGVGLGIAGAALLAGLLPDRIPALRLPGVALAVVLVVGVLLAVAAAWLPARRAARADVAAVLSGRRPGAAPARWPTAVGAIAAVGGVTLAVVAGSQRWVVGLSAGIVVADLGLVLACGGIVALIGRAAHRMPWAGRYALRDAARHRARTVPAIAAVLVAVAGASATLTFFEAEQTAIQPETMEYRPWAATGTVALTRGPNTWQVFAEDDSARVSALVEDVLPDAGPLMVLPVAVGSPEDGTRRSALELSVSQAERMSGPWAPAIRAASDWGGAVVADGSDLALLSALGIPDELLGDVVGALTDGRLPLPPSYVHEDGTAEVTLVRLEGTGDPVMEHATLPAAPVGTDGQHIPNLPILPESLLDELDAEPAVGGYLASNPTVPTDRQVALLQSRAEAELVGFDTEQSVQVLVEPGEYGDSAFAAPGLVSALTAPWSFQSRSVIGLALALAAGVLALAGTWSAVALSAVEARPDLATLAAVGATPSARRKVVAAQAATIAVIGSALGLLAGVAIGVGWTLLSSYPVDVPWLSLGALAVGIPVLAVAAAWTVTRAQAGPPRRRP
ncbi:FtsX-like permease family protein [Promicromonospora sp. NPDC060204]|uniref:FtsX-like permease family protein n=1 Tax=Promicromonospora sp. NPDC060204 TaxID=3347071 RepID=UPI00364C988B